MVTLIIDEEVVTGSLCKIDKRCCERGMLPYVLHFDRPIHLKCLPSESTLPHSCSQEQAFKR